MNQRTRAATESLGFVAIAAGVLVALNVVGLFAFGRLDCTAKEAYSLSQGSQRVAKRLTDRLEITAYFTEDLPPPFNATERYVRDLLAEYAALSSNVHVRFVNPDEEDERTQAEQDGVQRVAHQKIEKDNASVMEGYRGIVLKYLGEKEVIPVVQDTAGLEYEITLAMKKLVGDKKKIGIVKNGENAGPTLAEGLSTFRTALPTYDIEEVDAENEIPATYAAVLVVGPEAPLSEKALANLQKYALAGGSLGVFGGATKLNAEGEPALEPVDTGLSKLLGPWGVSLGSGLVLDAQCGRAPMRGPFGTVAVPYPPVPIVTFADDVESHPVVYRLPSATMPFASPLTVRGERDPEVKVTVLARSSEQSWKDTSSSLAIRPRDPREWSITGERGPFPLLVALDGKLPNALSGAMSDGSQAPSRGTKESRVLVAGSSAFLRDEFLPRGADAAQLGTVLAFALNAIDWLAQDADLIAIRAKNIDDPALEVPQTIRSALDDQEAAQRTTMNAALQGDAAGAEAGQKEEQDAVKKLVAAQDAWESEKNAWKWGNTLGIPLLFLIFGLVRWRVRTARRQALKI